MGYFAHHAVIVHAPEYMWQPSPIDPTRPAGPDIDAFRATLPENFRRLVIGPILTAVNGDFVFAFLPDGSKEGWATSDQGDVFRQQFVDLFSWVHEDGSTPYDVAVIRFGGDDPEDGWLYQRPVVLSSD